MGEKPMRILLTDDDPLLQELMAILLDQDNYSLCKVGDGEEALAACEKEAFDLIILDLIMPKMTGLEFLAWLRHEKGVTTPVLVLTSLTDYDVIDSVLQSGADDVLCKPLNIKTFTEKVNKLVRQGANV